jgi:hypothetical protein
VGLELRFGGPSFDLEAFVGVIECLVESVETFCHIPFLIFLNVGPKIIFIFLSLNCTYLNGIGMLHPILLHTFLLGESSKIVVVILLIVLNNFPIVKLFLEFFHFFDVCLDKLYVLKSKVVIFLGGYSLEFCGVQKTVLGGH